MMNNLKAKILDKTPTNIVYSDKGVPIMMMYPKITKELFLSVIQNLDISKIMFEIGNNELIPIPGSDNLKLVIFDYNANSELMQLVGCIREYAFRNAGIGVGDIDVDYYDKLSNMKQMIVVDTSATGDIPRFIVGGYRFQVHSSKNSYLSGPISTYFEYAESMYSQCWIELGRSFLNPLCAGIRSFDNVLMGLGYISSHFDSSVGFLGKITLPYTFQHFGARERLLATCKSNMQLGIMLPRERFKVVERDAWPITDIKRVANEIQLMLKEYYHLNIISILLMYKRLTSFDKMYYCGAVQVNNFGRATEFGFGIKYDDLYPISRQKFLDIWKLEE